MNNIDASKGGKRGSYDITMGGARKHLPLRSVGSQCLSAYIEKFEQGLVAEPGALKTKVQAAAARKQRKASQAVGLNSRHQVVGVKAAIKRRRRGHQLAISAQKFLLSLLRANRCGSVLFSLRISQVVGHEFLLLRELCYLRMLP